MSSISRLASEVLGEKCTFRGKRGEADASMMMVLIA